MRALGLALALLTLLSGAVCSAPPPARRDVVIALIGEPPAILADDPGAALIAAAVTESLVRRDSRDEYVPRLATQVPSLENGGLRVVSDRLVATFRLRSDLVWQDGQPLTADDVLFAWQRDRAAPAGSPERFGAERIEAVDVLSPTSVRVAYLAGERWEGWAAGPRVMPRHRLASANDAQLAAYAREPMHAGPFAVAAWIPGYGVTLSAFPRYALGAPALGRIEIRFFADRTAALEALRRGEVDVIPAGPLEPDLAPTLDRIADGSDRSTSIAYYTPTEAIEMLRFATRGGRFGDVRVRHAVELAVDRQAIVDQHLAGCSRVPATYLVPPHWAASVPGPVPRVDREASRALIESAGFTRGAFGIYERAGERMTVPLFVASGSPVRLEAARRVAGDLAAVGIAVEVRERGAADLAATLLRGDYDLALVPENASDARRATERYTGLTDPWFDVLALAARGGERADQRALYAELQRLWSADAPGLPLYQRLAVDLAPRTLRGFQPAPGTQPATWNVAEWRYLDGG